MSESSAQSFWEKWGPRLILIILTVVLVFLFTGPISLYSEQANEKAACLEAAADSRFSAWANVEWVEDMGGGESGCQASIDFKYDPDAPGFGPIPEFELQRASRLLQSCKLAGVVVGDFGGLVSPNGDLGHRPMTIGDFDIFPGFAKAMALTGLDGDKSDQCPT